MRTTKPLFVRALTEAERRTLKESVRSPDAFVLRRAQIVLASAGGERTGQIAPRVGFTPQAVRDVIRTFNARGLDVLRRRSSRPGVIYSAFDTPRALALREMLHQSPRLFDKPTSVWTLELAADVAYEQGLTVTRVSGETIRATLARMGVRWRRAKEWITSPGPRHGHCRRSGDGADLPARPRLRLQAAHLDPQAQGRGAGRRRGKRLRVEVLLAGATTPEPLPIADLVEPDLWDQLPLMCLTCSPSSLIVMSTSKTRSRLPSTRRWHGSGAAKGGAASVWSRPLATIVKPTASA